VANTHVIIVDGSVLTCLADWTDDCAELLAWLITWQVNPVQLQEFGRKRRVGRMVRVGARRQCCRRRVWARGGMQDVHFSPGFHQWISLVFLYTMVCSETRLENFDFWIWIKHPLFQEQALIPVVGRFQKSNTHTIYVVRQLVYSTKPLVCINQSKKQYKQRRGENSSQLNSTHSNSLYSSALILYILYTTHQLFNMSNYRQSRGQEIMAIINSYLVLVG
jgi:hypothetical protein